jgi:hypothetical protein
LTGDLIDVGVGQIFDRFAATLEFVIEASDPRLKLGMRCVGPTE